MYTIQLFGLPQIYYNGQPVLIKRRQARHLFYYLTAQRRPVHRTEVIRLLWPHDDEQAAEKQQKNRLRAVLGQLRRDLPADVILSLDSETLRLDERQIAAVDYWKFLDVWNRSRDILGRYTATVETEAILRTVIEAWHDEREFLAYQDDDARPDWQTWLEEVRSTLREYCRHFARATAAYVREVGATPETSRWMHVAARHFPLDEEVQKKYLEFLQISGLVLEARQYLQTLQRRWQKERLEFPESLRQLERQLRSPKHPSPGLWTTPPSILREKEQQQIMEAFARGGRIHLYGPAGIGKSTLLRSTIRQLVRQHPNTLDVRIEGHPIEQTIPYKAIYNLLQANEEQVRKTLEPEEQEYLRLFIHSDSAQITRPIPTQLDEILFRFLQRHIEVQPLILSIENAHFLDRQSLSLTQRLIERALFDRPQRLLILSHAPEYNNPDLDAMLAHPRVRARLKPDIWLRPLDSEQTRRLVQNFLSGQPQESFLRELQDYSSGNPRDIQDAITYLRQHYSREDILRMERLPHIPSLLATLANSLSTLTEAQHDLLYYLAALERPVSQEMLAAISGYETDFLLENLQTLETLNLVKTTPHDHNYQLAQSRISYIFMESLPEAKRRAYHLRIADQMSARQQSQQDAALLANHWEKAGKFSKAFDEYLRAARYAFDWDSAQEALDALKRAQYILEKHQGELGDAQIYTFYALLNEIAFGNDNPALLEQHGQELKRLASVRQQSAILQAAAHNMLSNAALAHNDFEASQDEAQKAIRILQEQSDTDQAIQDIEWGNALINQGVCLYMKNGFTDALPLFEEALQRSRRRGGDVSREVALALLRNKSHARYQIGLSYLFLGQVSRALQEAEEGLNDAERAGWAYGQIIHHSLFSGCHFMQSAFLHGLQHAERGMALSKKVKTPRMEGYLHGYMSMNALELGYLPTAWDNAQRCRQHGQREKHAEIEAFGFRSLGNIFLRLNDFETARRYYLQGAQVAPETNFMGLDCRIRAGIAACYLNFDEGWPLLQQVLDGPLRQLRSMAGHTVFLGLFAAARHGRWEAAERLIERLQGLLQVGRHPVDMQPFLQTIQAERALQQGEAQEAARLAQASFQGLARLASPWIRLVTLNLLLRAEGQETWADAIHQHLDMLDQPEAGTEMYDSWQRYRELALAGRLTL